VFILQLEEMTILHLGWGNRVGNLAASLEKKIKVGNEGMNCIQKCTAMFAHHLTSVAAVCIGKGVE
jgi:hypothetical protein